jgi:hypothetical protein
MTSAQTQSTLQPLIVSVPHRLGREEAKRRIDTGIARAGPELGAFVNSLDYHWQADTLHVSAQAMWQTITGRIAVLDEAVRVEIDLPWLIRLIGDSVGRQVRERVVLMLQGPTRA